MRRLLIIALAVAAITRAATAPAQAAAPVSASTPNQTSEKPLTLDEIFRALDAHRIAFYHSVPNFYCAERVVSRIETGNFTDHLNNSVTDSVFSLKRVLNDRKEVELHESRVVRAVNDKPVPEGVKIAGPALVENVFSGGLDIATTRAEQCYKFQLKPHASHGKVDRIQLDFKQINNPDSDVCPPFEDSAGKVLIDAKTMEVRRIEKTYHHHELVNGIVGVWKWSADYSPVELGSKTLWLPLHVMSLSQSDSTTQTSGYGRRGLSSVPSYTDSKTWTFDAHYSQCHRTDGSIRILAPWEVPAAVPAPAPSNQEHTDPQEHHP